MERRLYASAIVIFNKTIGLAVVISLVYLVLESFLWPSDTDLIYSIPYLLFSIMLSVAYCYCAFKAGLNNETFGVADILTSRVFPPVRYWMVSLTFWATVILPIVAVSGLVFLMTEPINPEPLVTDWWFVGILLSCLFGAGFYLVAISTYGVLFPAASQSEPLGLQAAAALTKGNRLAIVTKFLLGPVALAVFNVALWYILDELSVPVDVVSETGRFQPIGTILSFVFGLLESFGSCLFVAVLAPVYLEARHRFQDTS
ncbi:MAG: hypothetical protein GY952_15525 [Rhodobacteraceae bacterium]|nr:hypothetical protein [Paracoccaceae bacterium]